MSFPLKKKNKVSWLTIYITYPQKRKMPWGEIKHQRLSHFIKALNV
jgi:hypothetical protein